MTARSFWRWVAGLAAIYLALHLVALSSAPLTDDDDFYIPAGASYAAWLGKLFGPGEALSRKAVDAAFEINHEHPPFAKYVFGVSGAALGGWLGPVAGPRFGSSVFSLMAALSILWMAVEGLGRRRGLWVGGFAMLLLLALPRWFFHARVATLDVPVAGMYALTAALAFRAERSNRAAWALGPVFGLATATKLNAPFLVVPYIAFALLRRRLGRAEDLPGRAWGLPRFPVGLVSMAVLGPLTFFAVWPWMWFDTIERVGSYVGFHLKHYGIYFLYFGRLYDKDPFAPWTMPFVMAAITAPLALWVLAGVGSGLGLFRRGGAEEGQGERALVGWALLNAAATIATVAFSGGAKYGGAKLFLPFFPFLALLAGYGGHRLVEALREVGDLRWRRGGWGALALAPLAGFGLMLQTWQAPLSSYNAAIGGLRGATAAGFERQYYDLAFHDVVRFLNDEGPESLKVHFLPNNWEYVRTYKWYAKEGRLREGVKVVRSPNQAQWMIITHERRFARYGADLARHRGWRVLKERKVDGVPLWTVLERPDSTVP